MGLIISRYLVNISNQVSKAETDIVKINEKLDKLSKEIFEIKHTINMLKKAHERKTHIFNGQFFNIEEDLIIDCIERCSRDKNFNIKYLPDFIETKLYRNILFIIFKLHQEINFPECQPLELDNIIHPQDDPQ